MSDSDSDIARAYNAAADGYDRQVATDQWVRHKLWKHYDRVFHAGEHVLDVACGTGIDSLFLATRGLRVTAVDVSAEMIARLRAKAKTQGVDARITARVLDVSELAQNSSLLTQTGQLSDAFDGIVSGFAGLNTVPDLNAFATAAAHLLKADSHMIVHMLSRFSLWEWLSLVIRGRWRRARRLGQQSERVFIIGGLAVRHTLYWPESAYNSFFSPYFSLESAYSMGAFWPPAGAATVPRLALRLLDHLERRWSRSRPFLNWGRFFVLDMVRKRGADPAPHER